MSTQKTSVRTVLLRGWVAVTLAALFLLPGGHVPPVQAGTMMDLSYDYYHQQLARKKDYTSVVKLNLMLAGGGGQGLASGIIINKRWVLTAAHCVAGMSNVTFRRGGQQYRAQRWYVPKQYDFTVLGNGADIALMRLNKPIRGVKPAKLARNAGNIRGKTITSVGYGSYGTGFTGNIFAAGTKRAGNNTIDGFFFKQFFGKRILTYDFDPPAYINIGTRTGSKDYPIGLEYQIAQGDSGGGVFLGNKVVGIHSFGTVGSFFLSTSGSTSVPFWYKWIKRVIRRDNRKLPPAPDTLFGNSANPLPDMVGGTVEFEGHTLTNMIAWTDPPSASLTNTSHTTTTTTTAVVTPEPTSGLLLGVGALALLRRRRHPA